MDANDKIQRRQIRQDKPFAWQSKAAMKTIADVFEKNFVSARSVYVALTEIASDEGSETFTRPIRQIADRAGVSYKTAAPILNRLESLKLIAVTRRFIKGTKEKAESTYTMLGNGYPRLGKRSGRLVAENDKERKKTIDQGAAKTLGNSIAAASGEEVPASDFSVGNYQNQDTPAQNHIKWPEFVAWCRSKGGTATEKGFWKWLRGQKPQWRNKVRQKPDGDEGYVLNGKFFTTEQAIQSGKENPKLLTKFRKAVRRDGKIETIKS